MLGELAGGGLPAPELWRRAQSLDALTQGLEGLAGFLGRLAPTLPRAWSLDIAPPLAGILLTDMQHRLLGRPAAARADGEVELF